MSKTRLFVQIMIILLGISGAFALFSNNLILLATLQNSGTVPIPLVFDAPQGYEFWSNDNIYSIQTNEEKFENLTFNKEVYQRFPRHSILHNSILIPLAMFPLFPEELNQKMGQKIFCNSTSWKYFLPRDNHPNEQIITFSLKINSKDKHWEMEIKCL